MIPFFEYDAIVVGCGLTGAVISRELADVGQKVLIVERRNHIAGNMYDYLNEEGVLVQKYGPHTFHTNDKELFEYMDKFGEWEEYKLTCGAMIDGKYTPTPFNFKTIDEFYSDEDARRLKDEIKKEFGDAEFATVVELLNHNNEMIRQYAEFLFEKDYSLYTAKQWGVKPSEVDSSILKRVPIRFSYKEGYFEDKYQVMPKNSFVSFFDRLLDSENINCVLDEDINKYVELREGEIYFNSKLYSGNVVYTGPIDELFDLRYGKLPYRSLRFEWISEEIESFQEAPVVAYPQHPEFTRITEYTKIPYQDVGNKTTYAVEYSIPYQKDCELEPYYPVLTDSSNEIYEKYLSEVNKYEKLFVCGRLGDFKYYNMDQALKRALEVSRCIIERIKR